MERKENDLGKHLIFKDKRTFGQKSADFLTKWVGSWHFIMGLLILLFIWIAINAYFLVRYQMGKPWDPYPFILLNLVLSCLATIQAPIILMSQNRQAQRDRIKSEYDYIINKKAEKEIREVKEMIARLEKKRK